MFLYLSTVLCLRPRPTRIACWIGDMLTLIKNNIIILSFKISTDLKPSINCFFLTYISLTPLYKVQAKYILDDKRNYFTLIRNRKHYQSPESYPPPTFELFGSTAFADIMILICNISLYLGLLKCSLSLPL